MVHNEKDIRRINTEKSCSHPSSHPSVPPPCYCPSIYKLFRLFNLHLSSFLPANLTNINMHVYSCPCCLKSQQTAHTILHLLDHSTNWKGFSLAVLGLHCCVGFSVGAARRGYSLVVVGRLLLIGVASLVVEHWALGHLGFSRCRSRALEPRFSSCGARAWLLLSMQDLPEPGIEPVPNQQADSLPLSHQGNPDWKVFDRGVEVLEGVVKRTRFGGWGVQRNWRAGPWGIVRELE